MNISEETNKIQGLVPEKPGIIYRQNERVDELNERILGRFYPDLPLQPNLNVRPVPTKYSHFPVIDRIPFTNEPILKIPYYSMETNFTPANTRAPVDGYFSNVNVESSLRNQYFGLQRGAPHLEYIPSSQSDLYKVDIGTPSTRTEEQPYPGLFNRTESQNIKTTDSKLDANVGADRFFNNTRIQSRGGHSV